MMALIAALVFTLAQVNSALTLSVENAAARRSAFRSCSACPAGWECGEHCACVPQGWSRATACDGGASAGGATGGGGAAAAPAGPGCRALVDEVLDTARQWALLITSSDDEDQAAVGELVAQEWLRSWRASMASARARLEAGAGSLGPRSLQGLNATLTHTCGADTASGPIERVDMSMTPCWDPTDKEHERCFEHMLKVILGNGVHRSGTPTKIISTQPTWQGPVARAVMSASRTTGHELMLDVHLSELPHSLGNQFIPPLQKLARSKFRQALRCIRLHTVAPITGDIEAIAQSTGLSQSQVIIEPRFPVADVYTAGKLPLPGSKLNLTLRAQSPREEVFLGAEEKTFEILEDDVVTLVDFGPRPTAGVVLEHVAQLMRLAPLTPKGAAERTRGFHLVFVGTGEFRSDAFNNLYTVAADKATDFNNKQEQAAGRVRVVPFTHRSLPELEGRADLILSRSDAITAGQLLALAAQGGKRHIFVDNQRSRLESIRLRPAEAGNLRYLRSAIGAAGVSSKALPALWENSGMVRTRHCPEQGACETQLWDAASACAGGEVEPDCGPMVEEVMGAIHRWLLLLTSSGGSGHMIAAGALSEEYEESWRAALSAAVHHLEAGRHLLTERGYHGLKLALSHVQRQDRPVEQIDLMNSPCTNLLGEHGLRLGHTFSGMWNLGQSLGSIGTLKGLSKAQRLEDTVFSHQCQKYMEEVIGGNRFPHASVPSKIISCQPTQNSAIALAVDKMARQTGMPLSLDLHVTELPTNDTIPFFDPLRLIVRKNAAAAGRILLHTVAPAEGGVEAIAKRSGLKASQVVIESMMPLPKIFKLGQLPKPGEAADIKIVATAPGEEQFLGGKDKVFHIKPEDTLTLVMLGSMPTVTTMHQYREQLMQIGPLRNGSDGGGGAAAGPAGLHWVFLATGNAKNPAFERLYNTSAEEAQAFNLEQQRKNGTMRVVPFTGQPLQHLEGRADVTITRSSGITCGELLALAKRGDRRRVLLHVEVTDSMLTSLYSSQAPAAPAWEEQALQLGMVPWEAGNARYLQRVLNATLVTPGTLRAVWQ